MSMKNSSNPRQIPAKDSQEKDSQGLARTRRLRLPAACMPAACMPAACMPPACMARCMLHACCCLPVCCCLVHACSDAGAALTRPLCFDFASDVSNAREPLAWIAAVACYFLGQKPLSGASTSRASTAATATLPASHTLPCRTLFDLGSPTAPTCATGRHTSARAGSMSW